MTAVKGVIEYINKSSSSFPPLMYGRSRKQKKKGCIFHESNIDGNKIFVKTKTITLIPFLKTRISKENTFQKLKI